MKWTYLFSCLCLFMGEIECGGQIWLQLVSFQNRRGLDAGGNFCDRTVWVKSSDCDHKFIICLDDINGLKNTDDCSYGRWSTATTPNTDYITFGRTIGLSSNPRTFSFDKWTGSCKLKIDVYDDDTVNDDRVDNMTGYYYKESPYYNEANAKPKTLKLSNRVCMTVKMKVYCDRNYYGRGCDIYCRPSSKYNCNRITGAKRCTSGWTGTDCHIKRNACFSAPCKTKATCYSTRKTYRCVCKDGFTGRQCKKEINECGSFPCKNNGTCVDLLNNYKCMCPYGYSGEDCDSLTDLCRKNHCLNNSTCLMDSNDAKFHCECGKGWSGHLCGTDVNECNSNICQHKSTCENTIGSFRCKCTDGWTGNVCNVDIDECNSSPCLNGGICVNTNGSFYCQCSDSWNGIYCQSDENECEDDFCKNEVECVNDKFVIYLDQIVTSSVRKEIVSRIKWLIHKYAGYDADSVNIDESADLLENNEGDTISNVSLSLSINGTKVCGENLDEIKRLLKRNESELPSNIFNESIDGFTQREDMVERQKILKKAWLEDNWYLIMIAVGLVVLIAIVLFVLLRYNRKKQRHFSNEPVYMNIIFQKPTEKQPYDDTAIISL